MKPWKTAVITGTGVFTVLFVVFGLPTWFQWQEIQAREQSAVQTEGTISQSRPKDHGNCKYRFEVGDKTFTGYGRGCSDEPVGGAIDVYYAENDPENSSNLAPGSQRFPYVWLFCMLVVMPSFLAFGVFKTTRGKLPEN